MIKRFESNKARLRRHQRMRRHLEGTSSRPRLNVFRSGQHIYAQVIDDVTGQTLVAASSLEESLHDFKPEPKPVASTSAATKAQEEEQSVVVAQAATEAPAKGKAKAAKQPAASGKQQGGKTPSRSALPTAVKKEKKPPVEQLAAIANNRKVAIAREVGKLVAQRAKEKGVTRVVFDRGGYAYHGRVAALAEGAREIGLDF
jgi:ribosomal protein L18